MSFVSTAIIAHQGPQGVNGGALTSGAWRTRTLNTEVSDADGIVSIASNRFTLGAGDYQIETFACCYRVRENQLRLYNYSDSAEVALGISCFADNDRFSGPNNRLISPLNVIGTKEFEIQHRVVTTGSAGMGIDGNFGTEEFMTVIIRKL
jgi:hypothetical protein